jgi:hypothetical protein
MERPCPICGVAFEEAKLPGHISDQHKASIDPEITEARAHAAHRCVKCGAEFPSPEELSDHLLRAHKM